MKPTQTLPDQFTLAWSVDMKHNARLNIILQVIGLGWMALAGWLLSLSVFWLRPDFAASLAQGFSGDSGNLLMGSLFLLLIMLITVILHELVHGLFFWLFAGHRPEFGIGPGYAFAAMPDWFYPQRQYLVIGLAPFVLLTVAGLLACFFVPLTWLGPLLAGMIINAGGAIGDLYVCGRIGLESEQVWIKDTGDGFQLYRQVK